MPTTWAEINAFYLILGGIGIPLLIGFLTEAGRHLYKKVTNQDSPDQLYEKCKENRLSCQKELLSMHSLDKYMLTRQTDFREEKLPAIEKQLVAMTERQESMNRNLDIFIQEWRRSRRGGSE